MKIRVLAIVTAAIMAVILCACSKADNKADETTTAVTETTSSYSVSATVSGEDKNPAVQHSTTSAEAQTPDATSPKGNVAGDSGDSSDKPTESVRETETYAGEPEINFSDLM